MTLKAWRTLLPFSRDMKLFKILTTIFLSVFLCLFIRAIDIQKILHSIGLIGFKLVFLLVVTFVAYFLAAVGWKFCLGKQGGKLAVTELFLIRHIGEMVSIVNPTSIIGGDAVKFFLLKDKGIDKTTVLASVVISRALMVITQLLLCTLTVIILILKDPGFLASIPQIPAVFYVAIAAFILLMVFLSRNIYVKKLIRKIKVISKIESYPVGAKFSEVGDALSLFFRTNKKGLFLACFFFMLHWIFGALEIYFILKFLGIDVSMVQAVLVDMGVIFFKVAGAFVPGQIGVEEFGNKIMLATAGLPGPEIWITVSLLRRARQLFWIVFGLAAYFLIYKKRSDVPSLS
jgi:uncharacterized protein (TIRG00374 family)